MDIRTYSSWHCHCRNIDLRNQSHYLLLTSGTASLAGAYYLWTNTRHIKCFGAKYYFYEYLRTHVLLNTPPTDTNENEATTF
jgi:hypothetical protein